MPNKDFKVRDNIYFKDNYKIHSGHIIAIVEKAHTPYIIATDDNKIYLCEENSMYRTKESAILDAYKYDLRNRLRFLLDAKDSIKDMYNYYHVITSNAEVKSLNSKVTDALKPLLDQIDLIEDEIWKISENIEGELK